MVNEMHHSAQDGCVEYNKTSHPLWMEESQLLCHYPTNIPGREDRFFNTEVIHKR
jgi:hypothetical protein